MVSLSRTTKRLFRPKMMWSAIFASKAPPLETPKPLETLMNTTIHWCIFPTELIYQILYYVDPRDIIRWRTVSKRFYTITCDATFWKVFYAKAPFPRPPGPFPSQSTASLERTLVKSARLAESWTTRPMRDVSCVKIQFEGVSCIPPELICGRWLVSWEFMARRFVLHDIDAGPTAHVKQVLWEEDSWEVMSWSVCSMAPVEGQRVIYVLFTYRVRHAHQNPEPCKLLELRLNDQSGELYHSAIVDTPASTVLVGMELLVGKSRFLLIQTAPKSFLFDTRTRVFHEIPEFHVALDETITKIGYHGELWDVPDQMVFTDTHLISLCRLYHLPSGKIWTVIQAFTLPPDGSPAKSGNRAIRLTHEGIANFHIFGVVALKPSVDLVTGATNVRLLVRGPNRRSGRVEATHISLTLPRAESSAVAVSPMTVQVQHVAFPVNKKLTRRHAIYSECMEVSDDGHVRGFHLTMSGRMANPWETARIVKFTIDTSQDPWVIVSGKSSPIEWSCLKDAGSFTFDGMRGKLCLIDPKHYMTIVVVEVE